MKRYVHPLKSFASTPNYVHLYCKPAVEYCEWTEVQVLLRAVAEEARKLRHAEGCHSFVYPNTNATTPHAPRFVVGRLDESKCNCPRGKVLAMLEVEK